MSAVRAQRLVLLGMVAIFAAMLGRAGFVDWPRVFLASAIVVGLIVSVLLAIAILVGIPLAALIGLMKLIDWATKPKPRAAPTTQPGPERRPQTAV